MDRRGRRGRAPDPGRGHRGADPHPPGPGRLAPGAERRGVAARPPPRPATTAASAPSRSRPVDGTGDGRHLRPLARRPLRRERQRVRPRARHLRRDLRDPRRPDDQAGAVPRRRAERRRADGRGGRDPVRAEQLDQRRLGLEAVRRPQLRRPRGRHLHRLPRGAGGRRRPRRLPRRRLRRLHPQRPHRRGRPGAGPLHPGGLLRMTAAPDAVVARLRAAGLRLRRGRGRGPRSRRQPDDAELERDARRAARRASRSR